jgi:hypothetical protein
LGFFVLHIFVTKPVLFPQAYIEAIGGGCVLFTIMVLITNAKKRLWEAREFERDGITVQGVIIDRWEEELAEGGINTYVGYHFSYKDSMWTGKKIAGSSPYKKLVQGDSVTIRFLPSNPNISRIEMDNSY